MSVIDSISTDGGVWINPPPVHHLEQGELRFETAFNSDFWQRTWYGFARHSGHAYGFWIDEDFTVQVQVRADFSQLYDQAGLFIQDDETHWVKAGIEFNDDQPALGCVVTREKSDWSTGLFPGDPRSFWLRATLVNEALRIQYSTDGEQWPLLRLCPWPGRGRRFVGVMGCSPERAGLAIRIAHFTLSPPLGKELHDLS
ncbi:MAG: DUF1349 domain-containing protein [Pantoea sp.]|uniref:Regulation of enolase 1 n=1 Tax=Pantoea brenneri TaxID=472694 RepID=A0AAX3J7T5_9GAMM|nr:MULTISPECIES: DUF1349 domain-containing protein [Pantoea]MBS6032541.1 DUF1349 domain-containing protein [Pantoea sp.]MDH2123152.1 DUF1349 domain-containing protein [Pantoea brenneri]VXC09799.1 conserved hypothetical protein [Pantoea brenneri]